jgi:SAM-dependent methyltransferase
MSATDRLEEEIAFHDHQARGRAEHFQLSKNLCFTDDNYLDHETWIRPAFNRLGSLTGLRVLDFGCGHGMAGVVMARRGARVTGFDLSAGYLLEASRRAFANGVDLDLVQADGERLPFADDSFDRIWGNAILHHLDLRRTSEELRRVLRPGGLAVFCEPWGENPLLDWARRRLPYPGKHRTRDEQPMRAADLAVLRMVFLGMDVQGFQLFSMARRVLGDGALSRGLAWCDERLLRRAPRLEKFCRYVVLTLPRT